MTTSGAGSAATGASPITAVAVSTAAAVVVLVATSPLLWANDVEEALKTSHRVRQKTILEGNS
jgi:CMP-N-acetylneuraminic acid synthetase